MEAFSEKLLPMVSTFLAPVSGCSFFSPPHSWNSVGRALPDVTVLSTAI